MSRDYKPVLRQVERQAFCRACDKTLERNTEKVIAWYSFRNRGQHIYICTDCVTSMYNLIQEDAG